MLTIRERELLEWIEENPMVSQQELAQRAGITRSSVAVHISNLMKKGYIQGKGYVVRKNPYIAVVGAANMDIIGDVNTRFDGEDSNPGHVRLHSGGVARNQCHNLRLLGINVKLFTAFGDDFYGDKIRQHCRDLGIDISESLFVSEARTSTYLSIVDENGKFQAGVSDMEIYDQLTPEYIKSRMGIINKAEICSLDTNVSEQTIQYVAENCKAPLFVETISRAKVTRILPILDKIDTLKTDQVEAPNLVGYPLDDDASLDRAVQDLLNRGVKHVFMHLPVENEVICASRDARLRKAYRAPKVVYKNGARDSFMAALLWSRLQGLDFSAASEAGITAASICASGIHIVNDDLNAESLLAAIQ